MYASPQTVPNSRTDDADLQQHLPADELFHVLRFLAGAGRADG